MRFIILFLLTATVATAAPDRTIIQPQVNWPTKELPVTAPQNVHLTPRLVWRLNCGEDSEVLVGKLISASSGNDGNVLLVDQQLCQVLVVDPNGRVKRTVGKQGDGPGEVASIYRAFQLEDKRVGLLPGRKAPYTSIYPSVDAVLLDETSNPAGVWPMVDTTKEWLTLQIRDCRLNNSNMLLISNHVDFDRPQMHEIQEMSLVDTSNGRRTTVVRNVVTSELSSMVNEERSYEPMAYRRSDIDSNGRIAWAPVRDQWKVAIRNVDGTGLVVHRPIKNHERSKSRKDQLTELYGGPENCRISNTEPCIGRVCWRPDGTLWIEANMAKPEPVSFITFDELDSNGTLQRRVHLELPGDPILDELVLLEDGHLVLLKGFKVVDQGAAEEAPVEVLLLEFD